MDHELERIKTKINIGEYAADLGWEIDEKESSPKSLVMALNNRKIIIAKYQDSGYHVFFEKGPFCSLYGTIIDFVQSEIKPTPNLGQVKNLLRPWLGWERRPKLDADKFKRYVRKMSTRSEMEVISLYSTLLDFKEILKVETIEALPETQKAITFLNSAGISPDLISSDRFHEKIKVDKIGNITFPHFAGADVSGWEIHNQDFSGFVTGGKKSVWFSNKLKSDENLIIFNSALSALAYYQQNPEEIKTSACLATSTGWTEATIDMIKKVLDKYPDLNIKLAFDNATQEQQNQLDQLLKRKSEKQNTQQTPANTQSKNEAAHQVDQFPNENSNLVQGNHQIDPANTPDQTNDFYHGKKPDARGRALNKFKNPDGSREEKNSGSEKDRQKIKELIKAKMMNAFDKAALDLIKTKYPNKQIEILHPAGESWLSDLRITIDQESETRFQANR